MFDSPALETAIGLAALLFVLATIASSVLELGRRLLNSRAKDLERALKSLLLEPSTPTRVQRVGRAFEHIFRNVGTPHLDAKARVVWDTFVRSSVYQGATAARGQVKPAYLSAKTLAEAVEETIDALPDEMVLTGSLKERVKFLEARVNQDVLQFRAGLERWFDEALTGLSSRYRKRSALILFFIGLVLAGGTNASLPHVADGLWKDPVTRQTVVAAAQRLTAPPDASGTGSAGTGSAGGHAQETGTAGSADSTGTAGDALDQVATATDNLATLDLPIGWDRVHRPADVRSWFFHGLGWLLTATLVALGAPFWFDLLARLVSLRSPRPSEATDDATSATTAVSGSAAGTPAGTLTASPAFWAKVGLVSSLP